MVLFKARCWQESVLFLSLAAAFGGAIILYDVLRYMGSSGNYSIPILMIVQFPFVLYCFMKHPPKQPAVLYRRIKTKFVGNCLVCSKRVDVGETAYWAKRRGIICPQCYNRST